MGPFEMVVAIIAIITVGKIIQTRHKARFGLVERDEGDLPAQNRMIGARENDQIREDINILKERIQVLERIATDNNSAHDINRQIEALRNL